VFSGQIIAATNFQYFAIFTIIGVIYLVISYAGSLLVQWLERWSKLETRAKRAAEEAAA
jgi:polar amino acid transport system permease protein